MLTLTVQVNAPLWALPGIKEGLEMYLEAFGDARVIAVDDGTRSPEQTSIFGGDRS